jgi:curved DNA-binding protein CbpA
VASVTKTLYEVLGAKKTDDADTIKRDYRRRARQSHPDKRPNDPKAVEEFKAVAQAFEVLGNQQKRIAYDKTGQIPRDDDPRRIALSVLAKLVHAVLCSDLQQGRKSTERNLIADLTAMLDKSIVEIEANLKKAEKSKATLEDVASRITSKNGQDIVLSSLVRAPIQEIEAGIAQAQGQLAAHKEAWSMVKQFKFRSDKKSASTSSEIVMFTFKS